MAESRRLHAMGNKRFMKSAFVKETLGDDASQQCDEEDRSVIVRDGTPITVRVYRPKPITTGLPVMVYSHSGGWCLGGLDTEEFICRLLVIQLRIIIISVAYRLAPEFSYPTGVYDVYDVIKWVFDHGVLPNCIVARLLIEE
jgi:acetyl esterase/lipase